MVRRPVREAENPVAGERMTFLTTARETCGEFARIEEEIPAGTVGNPMHRRIVVIALRLRDLAAGAPAGQTAPAN